MKARFSVRAFIWVGSTVLTVGPALVAAWLYTRALDREAEALLAERLQTRGQLAADQIARRLYLLWQLVDRLSKSTTLEDTARLRREFTLLVELDDRASWLGVAELNGRVLAASNGMLEGADVSQRPWFRSGMTGPFAGDVHEAVLLAKLLGRTGEPPRFVDFSAPLRVQSETRAVLGLHVNWAWVSDQVASLTRPGTDVLLLSRDRRVLVGPADLVEKPLQIGSAIAASRASALTRAEQWPDGRVYMTAMIPAVQYRDLPNFGWSVIVRSDLDAALASTRALARSFWTILSGAALGSIVLLYLGATWVQTPLRRLAGFGTRVAAGDGDAIPHEETRYREAGELSSILVRLQSRLGTRAEEGPDASPVPRRSAAR